ncbi:MAG: hypothetical protein JWO09_128 [Bacteroidetes bacterium]|nr:hypothetical protein [Bacteroidota bacterium]
MEREMPIRASQHISESDSFKLFNDKIPRKWIVRQVTERDYGIDCYVEIVNDNGTLTGHLVLCQLKSKESISWTKEDKFTIRDVKISTTNYWYHFQVPVFLFLTDIKAQEMYCIPVDQYIRQNYINYEKQEEFYYIIKKSLVFSETDFKTRFYYEFYRERFESEFLFFLSNVQHHQDYIEEHSGRDFHLALEGLDLIYLESMHRNYEFLCRYFRLEWKIDSFEELKRKSKIKFPNGREDFYEHDATELVTMLDPKTTEILKQIKEFVHNEMDYWLTKNISLFNYVINIGDDGQLPYQY